MRGPVTPVCRVDVPCDAPFSAGFTVAASRAARRGVSIRRLGTVHRVSCDPGSYTVVPNADAPVISPTRQAKTVTVLDSGTLTVVQLTFDTGIR